MATVCDKQIKNRMKYCRKKTISILLVLVVLVLSCAMLFACNNQDDEDVTRAIYYYGIEYPEDSDVAVVYITFSQTDTMIEGIDGVWHSDVKNDGAFYQVSTSTITYDEGAIFSAVENFIPQEDLVHDDVEYKGLKVVLRYATIYKSIKSDGTLTKSGNNYVHTFDINEDGEEGGFTLTMRSARSAVWFGMLAGIAVGVALCIVGVHCLIKGGKWQKKTQNE